MHFTLKRNVIGQTSDINRNPQNTSYFIQSECAKVRTRKTPNSDTFHAVILFKFRQKHFFRKIINIKAYTIFRSSQIKQPALYVGNMGQNLPTEFNIQRCHSFIKQDDWWSHLKPYKSNFWWGNISKEHHQSFWLLKRELIRPAWGLQHVYSLR